MSTTSTVASKGRLSLSAKILIGLVAGIALGLFLGERAAILGSVAEAYLKLLQMTVLPYVMVSLIAGLGSLSVQEAKRLGVRVGGVLVALWAVALAAVFLFPLMFPQLQTASFFSTTLIADREPLEFVNLYIPSNPFYSLANNLVPAVVLFCVVIGIALMSIPDKGVLLSQLKVLGAALGKVTNFIVSLSPYGIFAIGAVAAGTLAFEDMARLQVYLISYIAVSLLLSLWVLPGLVAAVTPVPYGLLLSRSRDALVTAFMTGSLFAVLPLLTEETKRLIREHVQSAPQDEALADVIVPASFNFPHTGKLLSLSFILFAGWFADSDVPIGSYVRLAGTGLMVLFGNVNVAIPFLLDLFRIPEDTFQLFEATGVVNSRFGTLVAAVHVLAVGIIGTCAVIGAVRFDARRLIRFGLITAVLTVATVAGTRLLFRVALSRPYDKAQVLAGMQAVRNRGDAVIFKTAEEAPPLASTPVLDRIRARGVVRVGYFVDTLPYAFTNAKGDLVGFDVEMAYQLARDLGLSLELVPASRDFFETGLDARNLDLVMSGTVMTAPRAVGVLFSNTYLDETFAFFVPDRMRPAFSDWNQVLAMRGLRLGVPRAPYYVNKIHAELPAAEIIPIDSFNDMFVKRDPPIDAFVTTAERGSAYTLLHPEFSVAVPKPRPLKVPLAYVIAGRDEPLAAVINAWIELKRKDGTIDELFAHWILGRDAGPKHRRWSILVDVLHWATD